MNILNISGLNIIHIFVKTILVTMNLQIFKSILILFNYLNNQYKTFTLVSVTSKTLIFKKLGTLVKEWVKKALKII